MDLEAFIAAELPGLTDFRHRLHQIPEVAFEEVKTAAAIRNELDRIGLKYVAGVENAPTATVAWIGDTSKPCIALRADIDALPIPEKTGKPYASTHPGRMHACGHDGHMATLMGTATALLRAADQLPVCVKFLWQPAEEGGGGADRLVKAGVLDGRLGPNVSAVFGLHGWPGMKVGSVSTRPGPLMAATDTFYATFVGRGCHGAYPHMGRDPIVAAAEAVISLQQVVAREVDPTESAVVTTGVFNGGTTTNVIPKEAKIAGTLRSLSPATRELLRAAVQRRCEGIAAACGCTLDYQLEPGYPVTVNDEAMTQYVVATARKTLGAEKFIPTPRPSMGGEDFAYYLQQVPGCFFYIGVEEEGKSNHPNLHNEQFDFTDSAMVTGIRMFCAIAMNWGR